MKGSKPAILNYMITHYGITSKEAFEHLGVTRLSARIKDLRELGYNIITVMETGKTRYGETCRYARYHYKEEVRDGNKGTSN